MKVTKEQGIARLLLIPVRVGSREKPSLHMGFYLSSVKKKKSLITVKAL